MILHIQKESLVKDIQKEFNTVYPFLAIRFFDPRHPEHRPSSRQGKIIANKTIGELTRSVKSFHINTSRKRTVSQVENDFREIAGLPVQVYRKSGDIWIETSRTDHWTLEKQNEEGRMLSLPKDGKSLDEKIEDRHYDME